MIIEIGRGLINAAILAGCEDGDKYQQRVPRDTRKVGGYQMQIPPHDIAVLIHHSIHALKGKRMLCLGAETLGSERFIAEQLGILSMDVCYSKESKTSSDNVQALIRNGVKVNGSGHPSGLYDIITFFGENDFNLRRILHEHSKIDTLIACPNINIRRDQNGLRDAWFYLRAKHFAILQTPHTDGDGCGLVRITHKEELTHVQIEAAKTKPLFTRSITAKVTELGQNGTDGSVRESGNQSKAEQPIEPEVNQGGQRERREEGWNQGQRESREAQAVSGTPQAPPIHQGRSEDLQAESRVAPWGYKKDGVTPRGRPGRPVVV